MVPHPPVASRARCAAGSAGESAPIQSVKLITQMLIQLFTVVRITSKKLKRAARQYAFQTSQ